MRITGRAARTFFILLIAVAIPGVIFADDTTPSVRLTVGRSAVVDLGAPVRAAQDRQRTTKEGPKAAVVVPSPSPELPTVEIIRGDKRAHEVVRQEN